MLCPCVNSCEAWVSGIVSAWCVVAPMSCHGQCIKDTVCVCVVCVYVCVCPCVLCACMCVLCVSVCCMCLCCVCVSVCVLCVCVCVVCVSVCVLCCVCVCCVVSLCKLVRGVGQWYCVRLIRGRSVIDSYQ